MWTSMSREEKDAYRVEAEWQQQQIDCLAQQPLQTAKERADGVRPVGNDVWRNAQKKISCRRLTINQRSLETCGLWDFPTQFGDSALIAKIKFALRTPDLLASPFELRLHHRFSFLLGQAMGQKLERVKTQNTVGNLTSNYVTLIIATS